MSAATDSCQCELADEPRTQWAMEFELTSHPCRSLHRVVTQAWLQKAVWEEFASTVHPETLLCINTGLCPAESTATGSQCAFRQTRGYNHCACFFPLEDFRVKCQIRVNGWVIHKGYENMWNKSVSTTLGEAYPFAKSLPILTQHFGQCFKS